MALFNALSFATNIILLFLVIIFLIVMVEKVRELTSQHKCIAILVLGDIGRSPRMQRHAESILSTLDANYHVHFIGFLESNIAASLRHNRRMTVHHITSLKYPHLFGDNKLSFIIYAFLKLVSEILSLLWILLLSPSIPSNLTCILMQNPPSVPVVIIAKITAMLRGSTFVIDWHNFGFSILALKQQGMAVKLYRFIERYVGRTANVHLTVSRAMKLFLVRQWRFDEESIYVLYDRATKLFLETEFNESDDERLWNDLHKLSCFKQRASPCKSVREAKGDDLWMISSTSWTPDEDLNMLLDEDVLKTVDEEIATRITHRDDNDDDDIIVDRRRIVLFITGKDEGRLREQFECKLSKLSLRYIEVYPVWLESYANYVYLLKYCDIGLCFHVSSSGLDLPMKVVDMFGSGMPVIAIDFSETQMRKVMHIDHEEIGTALHELVQHNENGFVFHTSQQLIQCMLAVYDDAYDQRADHQLMQTFKTNIEQKFRKFSWNEEWNKTMTKADCF